jgi:hypothetical protein
MIDTALTGEEMSHNDGREKSVRIDQEIDRRDGQI